MAKGKYYGGGRTKVDKDEKMVQVFYSVKGKHYAEAVKQVNELIKKWK
jgi:hypothetical protein